MPTIQEKISAIVRQQLPEFVRSDYQTFISFLETYYKFLEQDQNAQEIIQNARKYSDIDTTASSFVNYFLKNYGSTIPVNALSNKQLLIKRLNDLYTSKGSELSYKLLFRILFDTEVLLKQPYEYVLRPSDGLWEQRVSIRVRVLVGQDENISNRVLLLTKNGITYPATIVRVKTLSSNFYEIFFKDTSSIPYSINDTVYILEEGNLIFSGYIEPTPTSYRILKGGTGFKAGQIFTVNLAGAVNTVLQIMSVSASGSITSLKFINYGYNFTNQSITVDLYNNLVVASRTLNVVSKTGGFLDEFEMIKTYLGTEPDRYFLTDYVELGYTGELLVKLLVNNSSAGSSSTSSASTDPDVATIVLDMGSISRYPGQYISNKGFLSEPDVRLQDDKLYQPFAYQLETEVDISRFFNIVKQLIHPAGTGLFNSRVLTVSANIKANVSVTTPSNIITQLNEVTFV